MLSPGSTLYPPKMLMGTGKLPPEDIYIWQSFDCCQDTVQTVDRKDTGEPTDLICLDKVGQRRPHIQFPSPQKSLLAIPGLATKD